VHGFSKTKETLIRRKEVFDEAMICYFYPANCPNTDVFGGGGRNVVFKELSLNNLSNVGVPVF
jgi:hypothetical protein